MGLNFVLTNPIKYICVCGLKLLNLYVIANKGGTEILPLCIGSLFIKVELR